MKQTVIAIALGLSTIVTAGAAKINYSPGEVKVTSIDVQNVNNQMVVKMTIDASSLKLKSNQEVVLTPVITNGKEMVEMEPAAIVAGRNRYIYHERNASTVPEGVKLLRNGCPASSIKYQGNVPAQSWMELCTVGFNLDYNGCCNAPEGKIGGIEIARVNETKPQFEAEFVYIQPQAELVKTRTEKGSAFIDFVVNKTDINPNYRKNPDELAKIIGTIDKVKNDKDVTITEIKIHGYASPEGPYANNVRLASGRAAALVDYVKNLYKFLASVKFISQSTPEDWAGLREYVAGHDLANKTSLLNLIDSDMEPDAKDAAIKRQFPANYAFLLANVYPGLRHSDYEVDYTVRIFSDPKEILAVMKENPGKLSLREFFIAANSLKPGTEEYNEVFRTAAVVYPGDATANLNAASASLTNNDILGAERYLTKAGNSPEAEYMRGVVAALKGDFAAAKTQFNKVRQSIPQSVKALESIEIIEKTPEARVTLINQN